MVNIEYEDFYLYVGWPNEQGKYPIHVVNSPQGETRQPIWQNNKLDLPTNRNILDFLSELIADPEEVELLGKSLHEFLFPPEVYEIYRRCREDKEKGLRIRLRVDPDELSLLPWEYCYDLKTRQFLALERQTPIVRYIAEEFAAPSTLAMPRPVKLLVVLAAPKDQPELDMGREEMGIRQALKNVPVDVYFLHHATIEKLHDKLLEIRPHILHFSGHGVFSDGHGALALENPETGNTDPLSARQMRSLLNRMGITLAVLNACETARHSTRDALMGVAQSLIREEIPAVIAMQFLVSESVALLFTRRLYEFLFRGESLEKIVTETRVGIDINLEQDRISWGIPVLFMRAKEGYLWKPETSSKGSRLESLETVDLTTSSVIASTQPTTTRGIFLKKVYHQWVTDVLSKSIPNAERRIAFILQRETNGEVMRCEELAAAFTELDNTFLLLGAAGSGKTIAICEMTRDLIQRANDDERCLPPAILRLATWRRTGGQNLHKWIDAQLKTQYGLGQTHLDEFKRSGLILILDGLDEVRKEERPSCVDAINEYCNQEGWVNIVVTCREGDYAELQTANHALNIPPGQVIRIAPLEATRINTFLSRLDRVGINVSHLYPLLENECTPLMTDVILQTYEGHSIDQVETIQVSEIWEKYVERKFLDEKARHDLSGTGIEYPPESTKKWLSWLARQLHTHTQDQNRFFIEEIQPGWLSKGGMLISYALTFLILWSTTYLAANFAMRAGLPIFYGQDMVIAYLPDYLAITIPIASLWAACLIWVISRRSANYFGPILVGLLTGIVFGSMIWIPYRERPLLAVIGGALTAVLVALLIRFAIKILGFSNKQIVCVKQRQWDWFKAATGLVIGVVFVLIIALVSDVTRAMFFDELGLQSAIQEAISFNTVVWWNWGLPGLLSMSLFFMLVLGLGWGDVVLRDEVDLPNQGIIDSGRTGIIVGAGGIAAGLIFSLAIGLPCIFGIGWKASNGSCIAGDFASLTSGLGLGIGYGLILGFIFGMIFGGFAWMRHYLVRALLYLDNKQIPWRFAKFLQHAAGLRLLRKVGGGFEFIDQELQTYFERLQPIRPSQDQARRAT